MNENSRKTGLLLETFAASDWPKVLLLMALCVVGTQYFDRLILRTNDATSEYAGRLFHPEKMLPPTGEVHLSLGDSLRRVPIEYASPTPAPGVESEVIVPIEEALSEPEAPASEPKSPEITPASSTGKETEGPADEHQLQELIRAWRKLSEEDREFLLKQVKSVQK